MKNRADEIRKRLEGRLKKGEAPRNIASLSSGGGESHPLFKGHLFLMQIMGAVCLFLVAGILFKYNGGAAEKGQDFIKSAYSEEFQFAAVKGWYEKRFGKPLALFPGDPKDGALNGKQGSGGEQYAVPAAGGKVYQSFKSNGEGVVISTGQHQQVETADEGYVIFAGKKDKTGNTVIIQHENEEESWYGMLGEIDASIKLYDYIKRGAVLGRVSEDKENKDKNGKFYFALKKDDAFIDPGKVVPFD